MRAAEQVNGIQSQEVISTLKHYALNNHETNRIWLDAVVDRERGWIMTSYNKVNGTYASGNQLLLNDTLKCAGTRAT